jgi:phage gp16-like protein
MSEPLNPNLEATRQRRLRCIHVGRKQLGLDEPTYRAMLQRCTGKSSAAELTLDQLADVIEEMRRLGFRTTARQRLPTAQQRKIAVMWAEMTEGIVGTDRQGPGQAGRRSLASIPRGSRPTMPTR